MLNTGGSGGLDPRPFGSAFIGASQGLGNAVQGNLQQMYGLQGGYGLQGALGAGRPGLGAQPTSANTQQPAGQGRFGAALGGSMQQLPYGAPPNRGGLGGHLGMNGLGGPNVNPRGPIGGGLNIPGGLPGRSAGLGSLGSIGNQQQLPPSSLAALQQQQQQRNAALGGFAPRTGIPGLALQQNMGGVLGGGMQGPGSMYNPSNDLLAMLNKASAAQGHQGAFGGLGKQGTGAFGNIGGLGSGQAQAQPQQPGLGGAGADGSGGAGGGGSDQPAFDPSEFPSLGANRQQGQAGGLANGDGLGSQLGGMDGYSNLLHKGAGQLPEFSMQSEDFPALPGAQRPGEDAAGGAGMDHQSGGAQAQQQQQQQAGSAQQSQQQQHFGGLGGRPGGLVGAHLAGGGGAAGGMSQAGGHQQQAQQQQQQNDHHMHMPGQGPQAGMYAVDNLAGSAFAQGPGAGGVSGQNYDAVLRLYQAEQRMRMGGQVAMGKPLLIQQQPQQQQQPVGVGLLPGAGQAAATAAKFPQTGQARDQQAAADRFGLLGLLGVIRMTDMDLTTLALGTDLTTLGLNLNSPENLHKTFASPWADLPLRPEPDFKVPACYLHNPPRLQPGYFAKFQQDTLFYIFYSMPGDEAQLFAADELSTRGWWYHKEFKVWLTRVPNSEPSIKAERYEQGNYYVFDTSTWETVRKDGFLLRYEQIENAPRLPRAGPQPGNGPTPGAMPAPPAK